MQSLSPPELQHLWSMRFWYRIRQSDRSYRGALGVLGVLKTMFTAFSDMFVSTHSTGHRSTDVMTVPHWFFWPCGPSLTVFPTPRPIPSDHLSAFDPISAASLVRFHMPISRSMVCWWYYSGVWWTPSSHTQHEACITSISTISDIDTAPTTF